MSNLQKLPGIHRPVTRRFARSTGSLPPSENKDDDVFIPEDFKPVRVASPLMGLLDERKVHVSISFTNRPVSRNRQKPDIYPRVRSRPRPHKRSLSDEDDYRYHRDVTVQTNSDDYRRDAVTETEGLLSTCHSCSGFDLSSYILDDAIDPDELEKIVANMENTELESTSTDSDSERTKRKNSDSDSTDSGISITIDMGIPEGVGDALDSEIGTAEMPTLAPQDTDDTVNNETVTKDEPPYLLEWYSYPRNRDNTWSWPIDAPEMSEWIHQQIKDRKAVIRFGDIDVHGFFSGPPPPGCTCTTCHGQ